MAGSTPPTTPSRTGATTFEFVNPLPATKTTYVFNYLVEDDYGVRDQNTISITMGPC